MPVIFVTWAHALEVNRERRVPIREVFGFGNAGIIRHEVTVGRLAFYRHNACQAKLGSVSRKLPFFFPQVVFERDRISELCAKIARGPFVQDYRRQLRLSGFVLSARQNFFKASKLSELIAVTSE